MTAPATAEALFEELASIIGWGATADDIAPIADELEAQGVSFIPTAMLTQDQIAKNPYAAPAAKK
ncbi:MAG: hypothetical protein WBX25_24085 [Rhodomicrobium sp.]